MRQQQLPISDIHFFKKAIWKYMYSMKLSSICISYLHIYTALFQLSVLIILPETHLNSEGSWPSYFFSKFCLSSIVFFFPYSHGILQAKHNKYIVLFSKSEIFYRKTPLTVVCHKHCGVELNKYNYLLRRVLILVLVVSTRFSAAPIGTSILNIHCMCLDNGIHNSL